MHIGPRSMWSCQTLSSIYHRGIGIHGQHRYHCLCDASLDGDGIMKLPIAYLIGLIFGLGISMSGMANPAKVLNFFDVAGSWDPSLAFVMGGAVVVTYFGYRWVLARSKPLYDTRFRLPSRSDIDLKLISGSLIFGLGWGLAGFCPGGALPALGTGNLTVMLFVAALITGIYLTRKVEAIFANRTAHTK